MTGAIKSSTEVMKTMSGLMKLPELQKIMADLSKEMMRSGIIDEMVQETFDSALEQDGDEEAADAEVEKIILEITNNKLKDLPAVNKTTPGRQDIAQASALADSEDDEPLEDMSKRLEALRS